MTGKSWVGNPPLTRGEPLAPGLEVVDHLSRSDTCDIYAAADVRRRCRCLAKALRPDRLGDEATRRWLRVEGRLLVGTAHSHVARAYETLERPRTIVLFEAFRGDTLARLLELRGSGLPIGQVALIGRHVGSAIRYLHARGLLHLGVAPSNVLVAPSRYSLFDLGPTRAVEPARPGGRVAGQPAPEQRTGDRVTSATDVWGLGALLFAAATARLPLPEAPDRRGHRLAVRAPPVRALRSMPTSLAGVIDDCLQPEPEMRPSVESLLEVLERTG